MQDAGKHKGASKGPERAGMPAAVTARKWLPTPRGSYLAARWQITWCICRSRSSSGLRVRCPSVITQLSTKPPLNRSPPYTLLRIRQQRDVTGGSRQTKGGGRGRPHTRHQHIHDRHTTSSQTHSTTTPGTPPAHTPPAITRYPRRWPGSLATGSTGQTSKNPATTVPHCTTLAKAREGVQTGGQHRDTSTAYGTVAQECGKKQITWLTSDAC